MLFFLIKIAYYNIEVCKKLLAHLIGGSVYITKECEKSINNLDAKSKERLKDELIFRFVKIRRLKDENSK